MTEDEKKTEPVEGSDEWKAAVFAGEIEVEDKYYDDEPPAHPRKPPAPVATRPHLRVVKDDKPETPNR